MKLKFFAISIFLVCITITAQQWTTQNPYPTANNSYGGFASSPTHFVAVTDQGEALVTMDGGSNWDIVRIGGDGIYRNVFFIDDNTGWAVGSFVERLHKTTDGGLTWTHQPNAPDTTKYDVYFADANTGWAIGYYGFVAKTTNGGDLWFSQSFSSINSNTMYGVAGNGDQVIYVVGNNNSVLKSTNGGGSWQSLTVNFGATIDLRDVYVQPGTNGMEVLIAGENNRIAKSTDGGISWLIHNPGGTEDLWGIDLNSNGIGLAAGTSGIIHRSTDGGDTWSQVTSPTDETLYSISFADANVAYANGRRGTVLKSTDAGITWVRLGYMFTETTLEDVSFANSSVGYVVGTSFAAKTTDGGNTFSILNTGFSDKLYEVSAVNENLVFASGKLGAVIRSTNGGTDWQALSTGLATNVDLLAIDFLNENTGYAAGTDGIVIKTTDGGATWLNKNISSTSLLWDMDFVSETTGWIVGTGEKIFRTTDGGNSWNEQFSGGGLGTYGVAFVDENTGIASGTSGNTYYTVDGGNTWNLPLVGPDRTVWGIDMVSTPTGTLAMTACASGYVFKSTDGGRNWIEEPRQTINTFSDIDLVDGAFGWIVGNYGLVVNYYDEQFVPVELASFSSTVNKNNVTLNWKTASEVSNAGFEIERFDEKNADWNMIGFVEGSGTSTELHHYTFFDKGLQPGTYSYRLKQIDLNGTFKYYNLNESVEIGLPDQFTLYQNYPNPFNPTTKISFVIPNVETGHAQSLQTKLIIYDILGNEIATLLNKPLQAGSYEIEFDASDLPSGVYFYNLNFSGYSDTKKMILIK